MGPVKCHYGSNLNGYVEISPPESRWWWISCFISLCRQGQAVTPYEMPFILRRHKTASHHILPPVSGTQGTSDKSGLNGPRLRRGWRWKWCKASWYISSIHNVANPWSCQKAYWGAEWNVDDKYVSNNSTSTPSTPKHLFLERDR